jgi:peptidoglycan/LPS O-acetylase OafA/YrhL
MDGGASLSATGQLPLGIFDQAWVALNQLTRLGNEAVIFFFVHSGFAIAYSLSRSRGVAGFYQRRFVRLYPTYVFGLLWAFVVLAITTAIVPEFFSGRYPFGVYGLFQSELSRFDVMAVVKDFVYVPTVPFIQQFWSLPHEVVFYILAPIYLRRPRVYVGVSLAVTLVGMVFVGYTNFLSLHVFRYNAYFAVGVALFLCWNRWSAMVRRVPRWGVVGALLLGFLACIGLNFRAQGASLATEWLAVGVSVLVIGKYGQGQRFPRPFGALGRWSYSLYVTHVATIVLVLALFHVITETEPPITAPWIWPVAVPVALGVAYVCYWLSGIPVPEVPPATSSQGYIAFARVFRTYPVEWSTRGRRARWRRSGGWADSYGGFLGDPMVMGRRDG